MKNSNHKQQAQTVTQPSGGEIASLNVKDYAEKYLVFQRR